MYLLADKSSTYLSLTLDQDDPCNLFYFQKENKMTDLKNNEKYVLKDEFGYLMSYQDNQ